MKKVLTIALLVLLTVGLFVSCNADAVKNIFNNDQSKVFTVTFNTNGGSTIASQTVKEGEKATTPTDPTFDEHTFEGWYKTKDSTTGKLSDKWNFEESQVTENITLYANWTRTISSVLGAEFPTSPTNAWAFGTKSCYIKKNGRYVDFKTSEEKTEDVLFFKWDTSNNSCNIPLSTIVLKENDTYKYYENGVVCGELKLIDGNLSAIKITLPTTFGVLNNANGTYVPKGTTFKAVYNIKNNANTLTFYFDNVDHSEEGTVYQDGTANYLFNNNNNFTSKWGYYGIIGAVKSVVIDQSVDNYNGLRSTAYMFAAMLSAENITGAEYLDVSNVKDMSNMFNSFGKNSDFNKVPDVSKWDTSNVTDMSFIFSSYGYNSSTLTKVPDVSKWDTSNVTNMSSIFSSYGFSSTALAKVPDVSDWNTAKVSNMSGLFDYYGYQSVVLDSAPAVGDWITTTVTNMSIMFRGYGYSSKKLSSAPNVSNWNTGNVTDMNSMFNNYGYNSTSLTSVPAISGWDIGKISEMRSILSGYGCSSTVLDFTLDLSLWNMESVQDAELMFDNAGINASQWYVKIPKTTGNKTNTESIWYYYNYSLPNNKYSAPASGKDFIVSEQ